ncbi:MAG TPA: hypothetical protein PK683_04995, partial [Leptospiraceae bacterium]|nr:hypothetical protein [Leptospiraceae bacterium]HNM04273.1 hypothetical protein [Leptospiraceae bacterium]
MQIQGASYCLASKTHYQGTVPSLEEAKVIMNDPELKQHFSPRSIRMAIAYGIHNDIKTFAKKYKTS